MGGDLQQCPVGRGGSPGPAAPQGARRTPFLGVGPLFYLIEFEVSDTGPEMNMDIPHKGPRGGTMRSRYFGRLEGVSEASKAFVQEDAARLGISVHEWLERAIRNAGIDRAQRPK